MNPGSKRIAAVATVAIVLCLAFSYAVQDDPQSHGGTWTFSIIDGWLPDDRPDAADDFYAWANYGILSETELPDGVWGTGFLYDYNVEVDGLQELIVGGEGEWGVLNTLWNLIVDDDTRITLGSDPLEPYIDRILSIQTVDDYIEYLQDEDYSIDYAGYSVNRGPDGTTSLIIAPTPVVPSYLDAEAAAEYEDVLVEMLVMSGFDWTEAERIVSVAAETDRAVMSGTDGEFDFTTLADIESAYPDSVIYETFSSYGISDDAVIQVDLSWVDASQALLADGDLEDVRCQTLVRTVVHASELLDDGFQGLADRIADISGYGSDGFATDAEAMSLCLQSGWIIASIYADTCVDAETRESVKVLCEEIRDAYATMIGDCAWMSDDTKAKALEKLEAIEFSVAECDLGMDLDDLVIDPDGNLLDACNSIDRFFTRTMAANVGEPFDADILQNDSISLCNASYYPEFNSVLILGGMVEAAKALNEQGQYGTMAVATVIAHEISHAFDEDGKRYGPNGYMDNWWTDGDAAAYEERMSALSDYLGGIELVEGVYLDGDYVVNEIVADLCSIQCVMIIASENPAFDYGSFFVTWAHMWEEEYVPDMFYDLVSDEHPPSFIRVNAIAQQFQEFHDTFGVTEGDGMWLDPEDRILVW